MTIGRGPTARAVSRAPSSGTAQHRIVVPFEDTRFLIQVFGEHDANLALIETRLGVQAHPHGNLVTITGPQQDCETAREVLVQVYDRVRRGEALGAGEIDGLVRHVRSGPVASDGMAQVRTRKRIVTARTTTQSAYIHALQRHDLVFGVGPAGTGKTYLAVAMAAAALERGDVERIVLSRPAVEAGERLGFLPGEISEKMDPYLRPLYDALRDVLAPEKIVRDLETGTIEIAPLAYMRGRTLAHAFVILDEAQNTTSLQMKMFLTRLGEGSRMVITGDPSQIDLPSGQRSGLEEAVALLSGISGIATVRFTASDVVRSDLVARIVAAYDGAASRS